MMGFAAKYAQYGIDSIRLGNGVSTQPDMMINPNTWREFLKPRLARVIKAAVQSKRI